MGGRDGLRDGGDAYGGVGDVLEDLEEGVGDDLVVGEVVERVG